MFANEATCLRKAKRCATCGGFHVIVSREGFSSVFAFAAQNILKIAETPEFGGQAKRPCTHRDVGAGKAWL